MQTTLQRLHADAELLRRFGSSQALDVPQQQDLAVRGLELRQCVREEAPQLGVGDLVIERLLDRHGQHVGEILRVVTVRSEHAMTPVAHDGEEPRSDRRGATEATQRAGGRPQRFLHRVFCVFGGTTETQPVAKNCVAMQREQALERLALSGLRRVEQSFRLGLGHRTLGVASPGKGFANPRAHALHLSRRMRTPILGWLPYGTSLLLPAATYAFVATAPHAWIGWLAVPAVLALVAVAERWLPDAIAPHRSGSTLLLIVVGALHLANTVALASRVDALGAVDAAIAVVLVGIGTAYGAGIVGHELVHRRARRERFIGRVLLWPALYDHFFVEHLRGHHVHAATVVDPTTARFDEPFWPFVWHSGIGQLRSAWQLDRRAVVMGIIAEFAILSTIACAFGSAGTIAWVAQAVVASVVIAAVNYFDHWGLQRVGRRFGEVDAWDSESVLGHYFLLALPRHVDHHMHPMRPYHRLATTAASPKLPYGYVRMVLLVLFADRVARRLLRAELARRGLGPFASDAAAA